MLDTHDKKKKKSYHTLFYQAYQAYLAHHVTLLLALDHSSHSYYFQSRYNSVFEFTGYLDFVHFSTRVLQDFDLQLLEGSCNRLEPAMAGTLKKLEEKIL